MKSPPPPLRLKSFITYDNFLAFLLDITDITDAET